MNKSNRRKFITAAAALGAGTAVAAMPFHPGMISPGMINAEKTGPAKDSSAKTKYLAHHVFFWLKNPDSTEDRDKLVEGLRTLAKIETIREIHIGVLASTEKRDVVDTSWQVSELMFFSDLAGQSTYQAHPVHLDFVKNYSHLWAKVVVFDAMEV